MFTVCPKCALTLVVTAADLRVAQGYVRCGRCSSVFNALARLSEERGAAPGEAPVPLPAEPQAETPAADPGFAPAPEPPRETEPPPQAAPTAETGTMTFEALTEAELHPEEAPPEEPIPEEALEFNPATTDVNQVFVEAPADPQWTAATGSFKSLVAANQDVPAEEQPDQSQVDVEIDRNFLASMLREDGRTAAPAEAAPPPAAAPQAPLASNPQASRPQAPAAERAARTGPRASRPAHPRPAQAAKALNPNSTAPPPTFERFPAPAPAPVAPAPMPTAALSEEPGPAVAEAAELLGDAAAPAAPPSPAGPVRAWLQGHAWHLGAAAAALALVFQMVNHNRDALAANPGFNGPLNSLYGALGVRLYPHWDLKAYDVRQLGATAGDTGNGVISVRATIKNASAAAQPLPLLRVILQDRFGNRVAMRDVAPVAYMSAPPPPAALMSAGQRVDAEVGFADPGTDAVSFEIDVCLPARGGVACANDVVSR